LDEKAYVAEVISLNKFTDPPSLTYGLFSSVVMKSVEGMDADAESIFWHSSAVELFERFQLNQGLQKIADDISLLHVMSL
jgi:hypothetical protein